MLISRVQETSTISGNGTANFTLAGASSNFQSFNSAFGTNTPIRYFAVKDSQWEEGHGYLSSSTVLVRQVVISNSAGTFAKIDFTNGTVNIFCANGAATQSLPVPVHNSAAWIGSEHFFGGIIEATRTISAGYTYCAPFYYSAPNLIDALSFYVGTAVGGSIARVGLLTNSPTANQPRDVIIQSGELSTASTGWIEYVFPSPISISGKVVWTALLASAGINVVCQANTSACRSVQERTRSGGFSASRNVMIDDRGSGWIVANGGSGLATFGLDVFETSSHCPLVLARVA